MPYPYALSNSEYKHLFVLLYVMGNSGIEHCSHGPARLKELSSSILAPECWQCNPPAPAMCFPLTWVNGAAER
jgi:hypothetical protein